MGSWRRTAHPELKKQPSDMIRALEPGRLMALVPSGKAAGDKQQLDAPPARIVGTPRVCRIQIAGLFWTQACKTSATIRVKSSSSASSDGLPDPLNSCRISASANWPAGSSAWDTINSLKRSKPKSARAVFDVSTIPSVYHIIRSDGSCAK